MPAFRAKQLAHQYYGRLIADPRQMTDLPAAVRDADRRGNVSRRCSTAAREITCDGGQTRKTLWRAVRWHHLRVGADALPAAQYGVHLVAGGLRHGLPVLRHRPGRIDRNLSTAEILEQVRAAAAALRDEFGDRLSNVVFMGMGEPLANYARVVAAVRRITEQPPHGFGISARSVTVSTVGLAPAIRKLADERLGVTLALSLHAPDDELRDTLVPVNNRWKIGEALDAARYYADVTGRRVSIEYALIRDVNDQPWRADLLGKRLHRALGPLVHVNLIPLNPTPGSDWDASPKAVEREFVRRVRSKGVSCTVRDTRGREIGAACGQLASEGSGRSV